MNDIVKHRFVTEWSPSTISGIVLAGATIALTTFTVILGYWGAGQLATGAFPLDSVWLFLVVVISFITTVSALFLVMTALGFADGIAPPCISGHKAYSIIGASGIAGIGAAIGLILGSNGDLLGTHSTTLDTEVLTVVLAITAPLLGTYIHFLRPKVSRAADSKAQSWTLDPSVVKDKAPNTGLQSPSLAERKYRANQHPRTPTSTTDKDSESTDNSVDNSTVIESVDTEFQWVLETDVDFNDIGGMDGVKKEIREDVIIPIKDDPERAAELGVTTSNIILHGPPGTGKTYMAKALATELRLPFVQLSGADIQSKWINESPQMVNRLFSEARNVAAKSGGAVVFIDELDSVLKSRSRHQQSHAEDMKVVNEFLSQLEETEDHNIVFLGATNRLDALDNAGIRPGRIDKQIHIGIPDNEARKAILQAQLDNRPHDIDTECIEAIAARTEGMVAADLELLVNLAAKQTLISGGRYITSEDLELALQELESGRS